MSWMCKVKISSITVPMLQNRNARNHLDFWTKRPTRKLFIDKTKCTDKINYG